MKRNFLLPLRLEILWWLITLAAAAVILWPVRSNVPGFPFFRMNLAFILIFITLTRYIFLLQYTFLSHMLWLKVVLVFCCIPGVFLMIQEITFLQTFLDERGPEALVGAMAPERMQQWLTYIRTEYLLFGVGSVIAAIILPVRLVISVWRKWNLGRE